jgi:cell shape-determining protein MreC
MSDLAELKRRANANEETGSLLESYTALSGYAAALEAEVERLREALWSIAAYGDDGVCPYGCDTPHIARAALEEA